MSTTSGGLPLMAQTQNSRYLTYNELAWAVNVLQGGVISRSNTAPPGSPAVGDAYIVAATATGEWAGHENDIAFYFGGIWNFLEPELAQGNGIFVQDESPTRVRWNGSAFVVLGGADDTPYTPAVPGDWGSPTPDDVAQGLDELAARSTGATDASALTYTPANPADWASPTPDDVGQALDELAANAGGTVTSITASNGVRTDSGAAITTTGNLVGDHVINAQTGTSYALVATDRGKHVTLSNAASIAVTIAQAGTTGFEDGYFTIVENIGVGAATVTPTTSTINGAATLVLTSGMSAVIFSDGTNYRAVVFDAAGVSVNAQTGTSYTYLSGDRSKLVTHTNASAIAGTLPQATGAFGSSWYMWVENRGAGTLTITPTTSTIDGAASLALTTNQGCLIASDGTNYYTMRGIGGSGSLTNWTEAVSTSAPNGSVPVVSFTATNAATNVDAAFVPKGTGGVAAQIANSAASGGNKRGAYSVDWQTLRSAASEVASGQGAFVGSGNGNTASATDSVCVGGGSNISSGTRSFIGGGTSNTASQQRAVTVGGNSNASSGTESFVGGGQANAASGNQSTIGGGLGNIASGVSSTVPGGNTCRADADYSFAAGRQATVRGIIGAEAYASGFFAAQGDAQTRTFVLRSDTTNATPEAMTTNNSTADTTNQIVLPNSSLFGFNGILSVRENATGDSKSIEFKGSIKRGANAAATALQGTVTQADIGTPDAGATWTVAFTADTTNGCLAITVTGEASHTLRWVARVVTTEVAG